MQEKYIPSQKEKSFWRHFRVYPFIGSSTQPSDTNVVEAWFNNEDIISSNYDPGIYKAIYSFAKRKLLDDTLGSNFFTNHPLNRPIQIVEAWFTNDNIISNEYDPRYLQEQYIPTEMDGKEFELPTDINTAQADPQIPEFTAPFILDDRYKIKYKNKTKLNKPKRLLKIHLNQVGKKKILGLAFSLLSQIQLKKLNWSYKNEKELPRFLKREAESLDYSSIDNKDYSWRTQLPQNRPKSFPTRYSDPGFRYYNQGGIKVEANLSGVPIYVDGKYVGDTPLDRPIEVEPGWHQVSGFSPVYTKLASQQGLQFVGYDSIVQNNEMYGSTTVYAEPGKLETVTLKFNQMGDAPKKLREIQGGMSMEFQCLLYL